MYPKKCSYITIMINIYKDNQAYLSHWSGVIYMDQSMWLDSLKNEISCETI